MSACGAQNFRVRLCLLHTEHGHNQPPVSRLATLVSCRVVLEKITMPLAGYANPRGQDTKELQRSSQISGDTQAMKCSTSISNNKRKDDGPKRIKISVLGNKPT